MNNLSETKINKFKVGDKLIAKTSFSKKYFKNKIVTFLKIYDFRDNRANLIIIDSDKETWNETHFRLATPAEVRKYRDFSEELENIINET